MGCRINVCRYNRVLLYEDGPKAVFCCPHSATSIRNNMLKRTQTCVIVQTHVSLG